jgi:hypothetical protein
MMLRPRYPLVFVAALLCLTLVLGSCSRTPLMPGGQGASTVSDTYTTYRNDSDVFSISYPSTWDLRRNLGERETSALRSLINQDGSEQTESGPPILTLAVRPLTREGFEPRVELYADALPSGRENLEDLLQDLAIAMAEFPDYHEFYLKTTSINGRAAIVWKWEATYPNGEKKRSIYVVEVLGKSVWTLMCTSLQATFNRYEERFVSVANSLHLSD